MKRIIVGTVFLTKAHRTIIRNIVTDGPGVQGRHHIRITYFISYHAHLPIVFQVHLALLMTVVFSAVQPTYSVLVNYNCG